MSYSSRNDTGEDENEHPEAMPQRRKKKHTTLEAQNGDHFSKDDVIECVIVAKLDSFTSDLSGNKKLKITRTYKGQSYTTDVYLSEVKRRVGIGAPVGTPVYPNPERHEEKHNPAEPFANIVYEEPTRVIARAVDNSDQLYIIPRQYLMRRDDGEVMCLVIPLRISDGM